EFYQTPLRVAHGCWEWTGPQDRHGYGVTRFWMDGKTRNQLAHRTSYNLLVGRLEPGYDICHECDNRLCVSPFHLFQGDRTDNMRDAALKYRLFRPCAVTGVVLTQDARMEIAAKYVPHKRTAQMLADEYGVSYHY